MNRELKLHVLNYLNSGTRYDGRRLDELREISVEVNPIKSAEGSARVKIGETEVIVGVKFEVAQPYPDKPGEGTISVNAELLPLSSPDFESGPPKIQAIELARVVDRGIRESKIIDMKKLCIKEGEKVWMFAIDICTINDAGNLLDAAGIGALIALQNARFPTLNKDGSIDYKNLTDNKLKLAKMPIPITVYKIGKHMLVDPIAEEETVYDARLTITTTEDGNICALQKGGDVPFKIDEISAMIDLAIKKSGEIRKKL
ncbi:MAG: exosome complex protein Rrp42 [Nanoarchaeota archaeon]|nr:exosome complex protein Rrp42 [Nanoarchaeota archaeon]